MTSALALSLLLSAAPDGVPAELQLGLKSLRPQELARLEKVLGPVAELPLYRADLTVDVAHQKVVGRVALTWTVTGATIDELYLRATPNAAHPDAISLLNAAVNGQAAVLEHPDVTLWRVKLPVEAVAGTAVQLDVQLQAKLPTLSSHEDEVADHGAFALSTDFASLVGLLPMVPPQKPNGELFSPPSGLGDLAAFAPSSFMVSVSVPRGFVALMPGVSLGEVPEPSGRVRFTNALVGARDFPVFVAKGLERQTATVGEVAVEVFTSKAAAQTKTVVEATTFALKQLERRVGPYPFTSLRVVEAPLARGAGGMEFPGLVTIASSLTSGAADPLSVLGLDGLVSDPAVAAMVAPMLKGLLQSSLEFTVFHELGHQYAACLVGSDAVDEPAADEPLAQHLGLLLLEWKHGKKAANEVRESQVKASYQLMRMTGGPDAKANQPTSDFASNLQYAGIVYGKAPLLYDAQRKLVGDEAWERSLKAYVEQHRYRWVTSRTLTEVAGKQVPGKAKQLDALRVRWLEETHGDEDVGQLDLEQLFGQMSGGQGSDLKLDPATMKLVDELLKQLGGE